jgi:hypothetical protein
MTSEIHQGPLEPSPAVHSTALPKKTWREKRWERRRRRIWFEEVLGWILVPVILLAAYWLVDGILNALGTSPAAIVNGISAIISAL